MPLAPESTERALFPTRWGWLMTRSWPDEFRIAREYYWRLATDESREGRYWISELARKTAYSQGIVEDALIHQVRQAHAPEEAAMWQQIECGWHL